MSVFLNQQSPLTFQNEESPSNQLKYSENEPLTNDNKEHIIISEKIQSKDRERNLNRPKDKLENSYDSVPSTKSALTVTKTVTKDSRQKISKPSDFKRILKEGKLQKTSYSDDRYVDYFERCKELIVIADINIIILTDEQSNL